ncbi:TPA: MFS transporter, partial [Pseudomonas aeruginosa]
PIIGGLLLARFWWGSVFLINVPVVVVAIIGTLIFAPSGSIEKEKPWDLASSLLALVALSALTLGIKHLAQAHPDWLGAGVAWLVAVGAGYVFVRRQTQLPHPLLDFSIFRNPAFSAGVIAAALTMFSVGGTQLATTQYFQLVAGFTPLQAGLLVSVVVVGTVPTALLGGAFLHKLGLRMLISSGLAIAALGAFATSAGLHYGIGWLIAGMVLNGAGLGLVMAVASAAIVGNAPPERAGMASSVEEVSYEFGGLIAVALLGSLLGMLYSTGVEFPPGTPDIAASGVAQAFELATQGGQTDQEIIEAASLAFANAYVVVLWVVGGILGIGAVVARRMLRAYGPGSSASSIH